MCSRSQAVIPAASPGLSIAEIWNELPEQGTAMQHSDVEHRHLNHDAKYIPLPFKARFHEVFANSSYRACLPF